VQDEQRRQYRKPGRASGAASAATRRADCCRRGISAVTAKSDAGRALFHGATYTFEGGISTLHHWRGDWWSWRGSCWAELDEPSIRSQLYKFTEHAFYIDAEGKTKPWAPTRKKISDLADALAAICILPSEREQPCWLDDRETSPVIAVANGLLVLKGRTLLPHSPLYFNVTAVTFDYDPDAPKPEVWLKFLIELWPDDEASRAALGEWFGYVISGLLYIQKILVMIGPTSGGKGLIARILTRLIGSQNVCGPTLNSLNDSFGLQQFIGKSLAIFADARMSGKDLSVVVERILSISGEDRLSVNRKNKDYWTGTLSARVMIISNELLRFNDASTAIIGRIILLVLKQSWFGREDTNLETKIRKELPGILNWSLDGLDRLTVTNKDQFTLTAATEEELRDMADLASPVRLSSERSVSLVSTTMWRTKSSMSPTKSGATTMGTRKRQSRSLART
jgi:putative DNA primase/helicase